MTIAQISEDLDLSEYQYLEDECKAFERLLQAELSSFASIQRNQKRWEEGIRAGTLQFEFQFEKGMTCRYRNWVVRARLCLQQLELQEEKDCFPNSSEEFRKCIDTAEEIIRVRTEDEEAALSLLAEAE